MKPTLGELKRVRRAGPTRGAIAEAVRPRLDAALKAKGNLERALEASERGDEARYLKGGVQAIADALESAGTAPPVTRAPGMVMVRVVGGTEKAKQGAVPLPQVRVQLQLGETRQERTTDALGFAAFEVPETADGAAYDVVALGADDKPWARVRGTASRKPQAHVLLASGGAAMTGHEALGRKVVEAFAAAAKKVRAVEAQVTQDAENERKELDRALGRINAGIENLIRKERD